LLNEVGSLFDILKYMCDVVVDVVFFSIFFYLIATDCVSSVNKDYQKVHVRYLIS